MQRQTHGKKRTEPAAPCASAQQHQPRGSPERRSWRQRATQTRRSAGPEHGGSGRRGAQEERPEKWVTSILSRKVQGKSWSRGLLAAPNLTLPSNVTLAENVPQNTLVASISAEAAEFDTIVGAPFIVNSNPVVHPFLIIPKGPNYWELITTNNPKLDYEAVSLFSLQVLVEDSKGTSATQTIVIEISNVNKAPVFTGILAKRDAEMYISENTIVSTVIYKVAAKDPDNDVLQYSIRIAPVNAGFEIDNTGSISTTTTFDYESNTKSYTITVTISDGVLSNTANIKVYITNVNDNVPLLTCIFISITDSGVNTKTETSGNRAVIELNEELPIGTIITTCTATDEDQMNDLFFLLDPGSSYFTIHRETGTVIILSRMDIEEVGFVNVHSYTIKVCDSGFKCSSIPATVTILPVNDNPPHCDQYLYSFTEPEPIAADTVVATLKCHDPDIPPNPLVYKANSGPVGAGELFSQRVDNPHIIQVNKALDYDTDPVTSYELMISVSDSPDTPHTVTTTVIVSVKPVNDFSPVFDPPAYTFTVRETAKADFTVGEVTATDADRPNCVKYGIQKGNMDVISRFWINPTSGVIKLITNPDFETVPSYTLTVEATDCDEKNPRKAQASVTIHIIEENDEPPICRPETYTAVMYDNVTSGININNFRLSCNDKDSNDTSMRFVIASGNLNNHFAFDPTHGSHNPKLIVKNPFDFENGADTEQKYNLVVHIIDDNVKDGRVENPKTGTVLISISVVRTNTPAPPTTDYYKRKGLTIVNKQVNTYDSSAWYVPFVFTLTAVFFVGLLGWACHLIWKYTNLKAFCQKAKTKIQMKKVRTYNAGTKKEKVEVITETTTYETVFDGEAVDPVTGNIYEYNTKSGARRWKVSSGKDENIKLSDISTVSETLTPVLPPSPLIPKND
ncbi:cadherin-related family member 3-like [Rhinophrynus dorsalis]